MSAKKVFNADEVAASILKSPKYRAIAPDAVNRIAAEECQKGGADCEKRARNRLHQIADAFMNQKEQSMLWDMLERGDLDAALGQHASTRERMATREEYMSLIARTARRAALYATRRAGWIRLCWARQDTRCAGWTYR